MRGLLRFLYKYRALWLFLLLEGISIWLLVQHNRYYNISVLSTSNEAVARINEKVYNTEQYFGLEEANLLLAQENALLREQLTNYLYISKYLKIQTNDSLLNRYELIPAHVERNSIAKKNNLILLDKGIAHKIEPGMGVINPMGVVGQVKFVSENFSTAVSVLHVDMQISSKLNRTRTIGTVQWDGVSPRTVTLKYIPRHVNIRQGDTVSTSGYNAVFPENIMIGTVKSSKIASNESFHDISVELSPTFHNLNMVYIIKDKYQQEIDSLVQVQTAAR